MRFNDKKIAGTLVFIGAVQFIIAMIIAEALYPYYSVAGNYISDLGVGSTALLFNSSVLLLGLFIVGGAYFIYRALGSKLILVLLVLTGVGAIGVGLFPETAGSIHAVFSLITFLFGGLSAIMFYEAEETPFSWLSVVLGAVGLVALALFISGYYLGLGCGGMERMIAYPILLWGVGLGGHLISTSKGSTAATEK
jgi:hypothetical membrane protein